ncbi:MAG: hypothetical protein ACRDCX_12920 [Aeromonas sp.]
MTTKSEENKTAIPDFFLKDKGFMDAMSHQGIYSDDEAVRNAAYLNLHVKQAICGSTGALNELWASVKAGKFLDSDYQLVKALYNGEGEQITLSTGEKYAKTDILMGRD